MSLLESEIQQITKSLGLKIGSTEDGILIKSSIIAFNKETIGLYLITVTSLVMLYLAVVSEFSALMLAGCVLFGLVLIISVTTIFKTYLDYLKISRDHIEFRNNFKLRRVEKADIKKVKVKSENNTFQLKNRSHSEYKSRMASVFIKTDDGKFKVFVFSADKKLSSEIDELAYWIKAQLLA